MKYHQPTEVMVLRNRSVLYGRSSASQAPQVHIPLYGITFMTRLTLTINLTRLRELHLHRGEEVSHCCQSDLMDTSSVETVSKPYPLDTPTEPESNSTATNSTNKVVKQGLTLIDNSVLLKAIRNYE